MAYARSTCDSELAKEDDEMMTTSELVGWSEINGGQNAHVSDGCMGYWADFPSGTSAADVLEAYMATADYSGATADVTVTATIDGETASVVVGPDGEEFDGDQAPRCRGPLDALGG